MMPLTVRVVSVVTRGSCVRRALQNRFHCRYVCREPRSLLPNSHHTRGMLREARLFWGPDSRRRTGPSMREPRPL